MKGSYLSRNKTNFQLDWVSLSMPFSLKCKEIRRDKQKKKKVRDKKTKKEEKYVKE